MKEQGKVCCHLLCSGIGFTCIAQRFYYLKLYNCAYPFGFTFLLLCNFFLILTETTICFRGPPDSYKENSKVKEKMSAQLCASKIKFLSLQNQALSGESNLIIPNTLT